MSRIKEHYHNEIEAGLRTRNEKPILFSTPMVQAILEGRKTQTRRIIKPQPKAELTYCGWELPDYTHIAFENNLRIESKHRNRYGQPGDLLWVRESFFKKGSNEIIFKANATEEELFRVSEIKAIGAYFKLKPSIHMPKAAARIWLKIKDVRVEQLQDISQEDAIAEGIKVMGKHPKIENKTLYKDYDEQLDNPGWINPVNSFESLWNSIHNNWDANPWVWMVEFEVVSTTGKPETSNLQPAT